jgi:monoamine oxidase
MSQTPLSRRQALRLLAGAVAGLLPFHLNHARQQQSADVVIIGAGVAGLAAAQLLQQEGWSVIVLEARDRIGGRIWTNRSLEGLPLDLGASWIHGVRGNPLTALADEADIERAATDYSNMLLYRDDGTLVSDSEVSALETLFGSILQSANEFADASESDMDLGTVIEQAIAEEADDLTSDERMLIAYMVNTAIEHEYSASVRQLSAQYWDKNEAFPGGDVISVNGYDWLITLLASGLDIRLNSVVEQVYYDEEGVWIAAADGEYEAGYAIVTVPLGVLKAGRISFDPPLPDSKQYAIDALQMGILNKLYLHFPSVFWDAQADFIDVAAQQAGQSVEFLNISLIHDEPVLLCFFAADFGRTLESWDDTRVIAHTMTLLRTIYGAGIPEPDGYLLTRWGQDPYSYGSYSFNAVDSTSDDRVALAEPVADRLFFAGEATHEDYPATVHGALLSGQDAAQQVIDMEA